MTKTTNETKPSTRPLARHVTATGIAYGEWDAVEDVRWEVREEIADAMARGDREGIVEVGGQRYQWAVQS